MKLDKKQKRLLWNVINSVQSRVFHTLINIEINEKSLSDEVLEYYTETKEEFKELQKIKLLLEKEENER